MTLTPELAFCAIVGIAAFAVLAVVLAWKAVSR